MSLPATRSDALGAGAPKYFTGRPCRNGHTSSRYTSSKGCTVCTRARELRYRDKNLHKVRERHRSRSKLPPPTRPEPPLCECCGRPPKNGRSLCLDHDHETGLFRGWLCFGCNTAIGKLGDNVDGVCRAAAYLTRAVDTPSE